ncbi:MAG: EF-hand domain-containing protein [Planctomycetes bacterium]|nr:EF-hand domain-containing protein [Planctomycetota bacterium]
MQINPLDFLFGGRKAQSNVAPVVSGRKRRLGDLAKLAENQISGIDTGSDDSINESELQAFMLKNDPKTISPGRDKNVAALFQKLDANGDGRIGQKEWTAFQEKIEKVQQYLAEKAAQSVNIRV